MTQFPWEFSSEALESLKWAWEPVLFFARWTKQRHVVGSARSTLGWQEARSSLTPTSIWKGGRGARCAELLAGSKGIWPTTPSPWTPPSENQGSWKNIVQFLKSSLSSCAGVENDILVAYQVWNKTLPKALWTHQTRRWLLKPNQRFKNHATSHQATCFCRFGLVRK